MTDATPASPSRQLRIAFDHSNESGWTGGVVYMQNLLAAIGALEPSERPFTILIDRAGEPKTKAEVDKRAELAAEPPLGRVGRLGQKIRKKLRVPEPAARISQLLEAEKVDVVFTDRIYPESVRVPLLAWIPDYQYKHLPEMAGPEHAATCERVYSSLIRQSKSVFVSSNDVLADMNRFMPEGCRKAHVVKFISLVPPAVYDSDPSHICGKYKLPDKFFYLPNQFWKHKNHKVVIEALAMLAKRGVEANVVCTGNVLDHRHPQFFSSLLMDIAMEGLHERFRILGLIPRQDVFHLDRQCLAILQPSLFEGWSTSIEEAKSIGKRVICANLAVNQEQIPDADFFARSDPMDLADRLESVWKNALPGPDLEREAKARAAIAERTRQFARDFLTAARAALA